MDLHNTIAEQDILGAILQFPGALEKTRRPGLKPEHFYDKRHEVIFIACQSVLTDGDDVNLVSVANQLKKMPGPKGKIIDQLDKCGGVDYLVGLAEPVPSAANVQAFSCDVIDLYARRVSSTAFDKAKEQLSAPGIDVKSAFAVAEETVFEARREMLPTETDTTVKQLASSVIDSFETIERGGALGMPTGFADIDKLSGGILPGSFLLVAGRPSMGKTTIAVNMMENIARAGNHVLFCSIEVNSQILTENMVCSMALVSPMQARAGKLQGAEWRKITGAAGELGTLPITIEASPKQTASTISMAARQAGRRHPLSLIIVDYLQLVTSEKKTKSRYEEVTQLSQSLKELARSINVPVMAISQLSRETDKRKGGRPQLSDLRDSGAIEQDADQVMLIYRPSYYSDEKTDIGVAEIILAKNRHGPTGTAKLHFSGEFLRFRPLCQTMETF